MSAFYRSFNSLLSALRKPNESVLMSLLYSNCVPCLTYAAEVKDLTSKELNDFNVALNNFLTIGGKVHVLYVSNLIILISQRYSVHSKIVLSITYEK